MKKPKQHNKKQLLIDGLYNYITNRGEEQLQLKPDEFKENDDKEDFSLYQKDNDLEEYKKDYSSKIDKQILIISQNIMNSLFSLNNQKFSAFMSRYNVWGFDITMQQFINNFYLVVKTDNKLRQFILDHMEKILPTTRGVMQKYLITHMNSFSFKETRTEFNKKKLIDKLKLNQIDIDKKMKKKDKKPVKEFSYDNTLPSSTSTSSGIQNSSSTTVNNSAPKTEIQLNNLNSNTTEGQTENKIYTLDEIMNGTKQENQQSPIEDNLSGVTPPTEAPEEMTNTQNETQPTAEEQLSEEQQQMEQQILDNLRREHPNLQRRVTTNG